VSLTVPDGPSVTEDALGWVRVKVLVGEVVVVVVAPVVVVGRVSVPNRTVPMARSPAWSPMARTQVNPAACWAGVGGHG
jgi:hypothetical protein